MRQLLTVINHLQLCYTGLTARSYGSRSEKEGEATQKLDGSVRWPQHHPVPEFKRHLFITLFTHSLKRL